MEEMMGEMISVLKDISYQLEGINRKLNDIKGLGTDGSITDVVWRLESIRNYLCAFRHEINNE